LIGFDYGLTTVSNAYWNLDSTGQSSSAGGEGKNHPQMIQLATFADWNIDNAGGTGSIWRLYEGDGAPLLRSFMTALAIDIGTPRKTYDGIAYGYSVSGAEPALIFYDGTAQGAINAGSYGLTLFSNQRGYDLIGERSSTLTIDQAALTVTANDASKTYDGLAYSGGNGVSYSGFVNGEDVSVLAGSLSYGGNSQGAIGAGNYVLSVGGLSSNNYVLSYLAGELTINPAPTASSAPAGSRPLIAAQQVSQYLAGHAAAPGYAPAHNSSGLARTAIGNGGGMDLVDVEQAEGDGVDFNALASNRTSGLLDVFVVNGGIRMPTGALAGAAQ
jgi:hypothetical protein